MNSPYCGKCGYDLTGSESVRCPECGLLFIEAGIHIGRNFDVRHRRLRRAAGLVLFLFISTGIVTSLMMVIDAARARAAATVAQSIEESVRKNVLSQLRATAKTLEATPEINARLKKRLKSLSEEHPNAFTTHDYADLMNFIDWKFPVDPNNRVARVHVRHVVTGQSRNDR